MQLTDYINVFRRRWWIVVVVALVAAASAFAFSRIQSPLFRSEARYQVVPNRIDNGLSITLQSSMNSYKARALAPVQLQRMSDQLELDRNADWLGRHVAIQPNLDTREMVIQVDYPDPATAQQLADAIGNNMIGLVNQLNDGVEGTDRINVIVNQPARSAYLVQPNTRVNVLAGAFLGMVLGILLAFLLEALDNTLKTPRDVERFVGLTTLGTIPNVSDDQKTGASKERRPSILRGAKS
ncbi:MAG: Wzz/FepE/Etk N-terminal domain-containing protein [Chloroflexota bacterium]